MKPPLNQSSSIDWFVARLSPGAAHPAKRRIIAGYLAQEDESVVERSTRERGFECYLPRLRKESLHHRTKEMITRRFPLFSGYCFVGLPSDSNDFPGLRACEGVAGLLGFDGRPWPIPDVTVAALQAAEAAQTFDDTREARILRKQEGRTQRETIAMRFPAGAAVKIAQGPFAGFHGMVESVSGQGMVRAMIDVFARLTPVDLPATVLQRVA